MREFCFIDVVKASMRPCFSFLIATVTKPLGKLEAINSLEVYRELKHILQSKAAKL